MATQAALIAETIIGMKRALRRERDDSGPDDPITQPTNRGNKMHANAKYVSEGAMGYINGEEFYKEKVDHAGYTRYILNRNPTRYDSDGDELVEDEEDSEADLAAAEENPFSGIALETLLCPLKHPSELPSHPSMSQPYTSEALDQMTQAVEEKLRQERALLWRARNLHRQFLGDGGWIPCGIVETEDDRYIFQPRDDRQTTTSVKQKRQNGSENTHVNGVEPGAQQENSTSAEVQQPQSETNNNVAVAQSTNNDVEMAEIPLASAEIPMNADPNEPLKVMKSEEADAPVADLPQHPAGADESSEKQEEMDTSNGGGKRTGTGANGDGDSNDPQNNEGEQDEEMHDGSSPEPPRRMTTRAQANNAGNPLDGSPMSSTDTLGAFPNPHPLYLMPENVRPDANFGLPPAEAEETRRLLWSYIQKQEETVRGFEHMLDSLLRAYRMKSDVLEWCKAEGHVGEMSDGEDWYDREKWGLAENEDLKKGTDEDEIETVDEARTTAKRGRGRRQ